uniref:Uncharacterized protein n=1 Tax=Anopheles atroparvus TaxID=41427 RepID=A0AAG5DJ37_ANOAO
QEAPPAAAVAAVAAVGRLHRAASWWHTPPRCRTPSRCLGRTVAAVVVVHWKEGRRRTTVGEVAAVVVGAGR